MVKSDVAGADAQRHYEDCDERKAGSAAQGCERRNGYREEKNSSHAQLQVARACSRSNAGLPKVRRAA